MDEAEKGAVLLVKAGENATKVLEFVEAAFDQVSLAVEPRIVRALDLGPLMGRNHRLAATFLQIGDEVRSGVAAIRHHFLEGQAVEQGARLRTFMTLPSS